MNIKFNLGDRNRKELVKAISEILGIKAVYKFMPTAAFEIGCYTVTKEGTLEFSDRTDSKKVKLLLDSLAERGFVAATGDILVGNEKVSEESESEALCKSVGLTIEIPADKVNVQNLTNLLQAKGELIEKALGISDTKVETLKDRVVFPWFGEVTSDEAQTYTHFIAALCKMSKNQTRISSKKKEVDNEKYAFRTFLIRLGFVGSEYKTERAILLRNLSGSSAFRHGRV